MRNDNAKEGEVTLLTVLFDLGMVEDVSDLYYLTREDLIKAIWVGNKVTAIETREKREKQWTKRNT